MEKKKNRKPLKVKKRSGVKKTDSILTMPLDPDRPMLEQLEERALENDLDLSLLKSKIYRNPERMSLLTGVASKEPSKNLFTGMSDKDIDAMIDEVIAEERRVKMSRSKEELKEKARAHWKKHNPEMFKELKESGELEESLDQAAENTLDGMKRIEEHMMKKNGYTKDQAERCAWEMMREEWILLPEGSPEE